MKKITIILFAFLAFTTMSKAQDSQKGLNGSLSLTSQHWARGVAYSVAPSFESNLQYNFCKGFSLGADAVIALNEVEGYGNEFNTYARISKKDISLTVKDYFHLYGYGAEENLYGDWGKNTRHFVEGSLKYSNENFYGLVAYTFLQNESIEKTGIYFEAGYKIKKNLEVSAGYVTDYYAVDHREDAGITHIGLSHTRDLKISDSWTSKVKAGFFVNPTYENVSDNAGISRTPVNATVSLSF